MMYNNKFVASIKVGGKILREFKDEVRIPFGSEYSLYLKNLNSVRAMVKVSIDGEDVLNGSQLIVMPNDSIDLERYLKDLNRGNRFKFIERSKSVEDHRGIKAEDGIVRIEFAFEKEREVYCYPVFSDNGENYSTKLSKSYRGILRDGDVTRSIGNAQLMNCSTASSVPVSDVGITVPGSISEQKFSTGSWFATGQSEVIVLRLIGDLGTSQVITPVTVKSKARCTTCNTVNKATAKFCRECGTALELI